MKSELPRGRFFLRKNRVKLRFFGAYRKQDCCTYSCFGIHDATVWMRDLCGFYVCHDSNS